MSERDENEQQDQSEDTADSVDESDDLSDRISEALQPALSSVSVRVAEAVTAQLASGGSGHGGDDSRSTSENNDAEADEESHSGEDDQTFLGRAASSLSSSFFSSLKDEGGEQLEEIIESTVDQLFTRRARGAARTLADDALQAALNDVLQEIDDPAERYQLYRDVLRKLRPIVRDAVDATYTDENRDVLKRQLRGTVPYIMNGEFHTAFQMIVDALSEVTDAAEEVIWQNSGVALRVFQQISTDLLEDYVQDEAEERINPEEIQQRVQEKAEEARSKLQETVGALQDGVRSAQQQIGERMGGSGERGGPGKPPSSQPPTGLPPFGFPPSGRPPSGRPPSGLPPFGRPPDGLPPEVHRRRSEQENAGSRYRSRKRRTRRLPEA